MKIGVFGRYVDGKKRLENTTALGIHFSYLIDQHIKNSISDRRNIRRYHQSLKEWIQVPAVYMPRVLAIADEKQKVVTYVFQDEVEIDESGNIVGGDRIYPVSNPDLLPVLLLRVETDDTNVTSARYEVDTIPGEIITVDRNTTSNISLLPIERNVTKVTLNRINSFSSGITRINTRVTFERVLP